MVEVGLDRICGIQSDYTLPLEILSLPIHDIGIKHISQTHLEVVSDLHSFLEACCRIGHKWTFYNYWEDYIKKIVYGWYYNLKYLRFSSVGW